jgi:hypothetical protein
MSLLKPAIIVGILIACGMAVFDHSAPDSLLRSLLIYPLFPGYFAGFVLGQQGEYKLVGYLSCWIVDTGVYLFLWNMLLVVIKRRPVCQHRQPI